MTPAAQRWILHVDMDAFFVSVELLRHPELAGRPVVVGGTGPRGVVAAASYEARRYGVRSAMPSSVARRRCPDVVFLPGDHRHYGEVSATVNDLFRAVTPLVEPLSLDEAFLDITAAQRLFGSPEAIAHRLRADVLERTGLRCSVGGASLKYLAKLASEAAKPVAGPAGVREGAGVVLVAPGHELAFLHPLPVAALWGVGPATLDRLERLGVRTVGDLAALGESTLVSTLGKAAGSHLFALAWARDDRAVEPERDVKSISHEETYPTDKTTRDELRSELARLADGVAVRLRAAGLGARTVTLKVRFAGFDTVTRSTTLRDPVSTAHQLGTTAERLFDTIDPSPGVRLLGVAASNLGPPAEQLTLSLDEQQEPEWAAAEATLDAIRSRFGVDAIGPASSVRDGRVRAVRRGQQQWGPDQPTDAL